MVELLTKDDVKLALKEVLSDSTALAPIIEPIAERAATAAAEIIVATRTEAVVLKVTKDKFERVLGIDCTDPVAREQTRKDMEFARKARIYLESDEGAQRVQDTKRLFKVLDAAVAQAVRGAVVVIFSGIVAIIVAGASDPGVLKKLFHWGGS